MYFWLVVWNMNLIFPYIIYIYILGILLVGAAPGNTFCDFPFSWEQLSSQLTNSLHHFSQGWRKTTNQTAIDSDFILQRISFWDDLDFFCPCFLCRNWPGIWTSKVAHDVKMVIYITISGYSKIHHSYAILIHPP